MPPTIAIEVDMLLARVGYALAKMWRYSAELGKFTTQSHLIASNLEQITVERLEKAHVAVLVLDFDGVLAPHGAKQPLPEAHDWLRQMAMNLGEQRIVILSNKPMPIRQVYFGEHFPGIEFVQSVRKKPYPDGLASISLQKGVPSYRLLLVDDRLLTGILATIIAKTQAIWFMRPYRDFRARPVSESFFATLRAAEKILVKCLRFIKGG